MTVPSKEQVEQLFALHDSKEVESERLLRSYGLDDTRSWVDPNGYRLSDRLWQGSRAVRSQIDDMLRRSIATGEDALVAARKMEQFLDPAFAPVRNARGRLVRNQRRGIVTAAPGRGGMGSFPARRLARTEITRAHGAATEFAAARNPFALGIKWNLSGSHPKADECDRNANADNGLGSGVYAVGRLPRYPAHPQDLCNLSQAVREDTDTIIDELRAKYDLGPPILRSTSEAIAQPSKPTPIRSKAAESATPAHPLTSTAPESVLRKEDAIRRNPKESAHTYDRAGSIIFEKQGEKSFVSFEDDEISKMKDAILTHNHPGGLDYPDTDWRSNGNSFSGADWVMAVSGDLAEIRAITPKLRFSISRPAGGWTVTPQEMETIHFEEEAAVMAEQWTAIGARRLSLDLAASRHCDLIARRIAARVGAKYQAWST